MRTGASRAGWPVFRGTFARGALALAVLLAACGPAVTPTPAPTPITHAVTGTFTLRQDEPVIRGAGCKGTHGYDDIRDGLGVVARDAANMIVATGSLRSVPATGAGTTICGYTFSLVVPDADFYTFEVGDRGALTYSRAELEARDWTVGFTLGD